VHDIAGRVLLLLAGLAGAAGVGLSAMAAHASGGPNLATAANMLLFHAPALLGLAVAPPRVSLRLAGFVLAAGTALFCGDLLLRHFMDEALFPYAAPTGGILMIVGWIAVAIAALF